MSPHQQGYKVGWNENRQGDQGHRQPETPSFVRDREEIKRQKGDRNHRFAELETKGFHED